MEISYDKLWTCLKEKGKTWDELMENNNNITDDTYTKIGWKAILSYKEIREICKELNCKVDDILERDLSVCKIPYGKDVKVIRKKRWATDLIDVPYVYYKENTLIGYALDKNCRTMHIEKGFASYINDNINESDSLWVNKLLEKYDLLIGDLAYRIGKSERIVNEWCTNNEVKISDDDKIKIISAVTTEESFEGFKRMHSREFSKLLNRLLEEFKNETTQQEVAESVNISQKVLNDYKNVNKNVRVRVETQYHLLMYFAELGTMNNCKFMPRHQSSMQDLFYLDVKVDGIYSNEEVADIMDTTVEALINDDWSGEMEEFDDSYLYDNYNEYKEIFFEYPYGIQRLILDHFEVFCFGTWITPDGEVVGSEDGVIRCMEKFKELSRENRDKVIAEIEKTLPKEYEDDNFRTTRFDLITSYRVMIKLLKENPYYVDELSRQTNCSEKELHKNEADLEKNIPRMDVPFENIEYKLDFSAYDWYVWMLFVIYKNDYLHLYELIKKYF